MSVLLDARPAAWRDPEIEGSSRLHDQHRRLGVVEMPALDSRECQRALEHYESLTETESGLTGDQLYEELQTADIGGPLMLAYRLTGPPSVDAGDRAVSAVHADVRGTYTTVDEWADGDDLPQTVAAMVNVLNAAELPVEAALVHALATDRDDHLTIERTLGFLEGTMLEQAPDGVRTPLRCGRRCIWSDFSRRQASDWHGTASSGVSKPCFDSPTRRAGETKCATGSAKSPKYSRPSQTRQLRKPTASCERLAGLAKSAGLSECSTEAPRRGASTSPRHARVRLNARGSTSED